MTILADKFILPQIGPKKKVSAEYSILFLRCSQKAEQQSLPFGQQ
jgi:hypothetical protein